MGTGRKLLIVGDSFVAQDNDEHHEWAWWNRLAQDIKCEGKRSDAYCEIWLK